MSLNITLDKLLAVAEGSATDSYRPVLKHLHFRGDIVESTNGFMLMQVKHGEPVKNEMLVPVESIKQAKALTTVKHLPIQIDKDGIQANAGRVNYEVEEMTFPVTDKVIPAIDDEKNTKVCLNIKYLESILKAAKRLGIERLIVRTSKGNTTSCSLAPVRFDDEQSQFLAVLMPINID